MKIVDIETYAVSAGWKNWLFVKVIADSDVYGIAEATINGFTATTETAVHELAHFVIGKDPLQVNSSPIASSIRLLMLGISIGWLWGRSRSHAGTSSARASACRSGNCSAGRSATPSSPMPTAGTAPNARRSTFSDRGERS